jgi:hypothetical protein
MSMHVDVQLQSYVNPPFGCTNTPIGASICVQEPINLPATH